MSPTKPDAVTDRVIAELRRRHDKGLETYGVPLEQSPLTRREMLQMAKEEALDLACYLQRLIDMEDEAAARAAREEG